MKTHCIAAIALLAASCAKDSNGTPAPAETNPPPAAAKSTVPPEKGVAAPTEAIGANRVQPLAVTGDGTLADTEEYTLLLEAPAEVSQGSPARVSFVVKPKKGWKLNEEYPPKLKLNPPEGVEVDKPNQGKDDAVSYTKKEASWAINLKATSAGKKTVSGKLKFAVCTETTCNPRSPELAFAFDVK